MVVLVSSLVIGNVCVGIGWVASPSLASTFLCRLLLCLFISAHLCYCCYYHVKMGYLCYSHLDHLYFYHACSHCCICHYNHMFVPPSLVCHFGSCGAGLLVLVLFMIFGRFDDTRGLGIIWMKHCSHIAFCLCQCQ